MSHMHGVRQLSKEKPTRVRESDLGMMDLPYLFLTLILTAVGLLVLYSASYASAYYLTGNPAGYFVSQMIFAVAGIVTMLFVSRVPYAWYQKYSLPLYLVTLGLLGAVLLFGTNVNGATRWINLGFTQFQPSEIAKFALILSLATLMTRFREDIKSLRTFFICAAALLLIAVLLILEPHFSATIIIGALSFCMMLVGGVNRKYLGIVAAIGVTGLLLLLLTGGSILLW